MEKELLWVELKHIHTRQCTLPHELLGQLSGRAQVYRRTQYNAKANLKSYWLKSNRIGSKMKLISPHFLELTRKTDAWKIETIKKSFF